MLNDIKTTNKLLLFLVIPVVFYIIKLLSFIFIPLVGAIFIAMIFMPLMRWMAKRKMPRWLSIMLVILILLGTIKLGGEVVQMAGRQIAGADPQFWQNVEQKLDEIILPVEIFFGMDVEDGRSSLTRLIEVEEISTALFKNVDSLVQYLRSTLSILLMMFFFMLLLLAGSVDLQQILEQLIFKQKTMSIRTISKIESNFVKFIEVKFVLSLLTGIGFGLTSYLFGISFPLIWGLLAFALNFIQVVGSVTITSVLALFAFLELDPSGTLLFFVLVLIGIQVLFGGILEPIFMGKSFSINTITILVMLMFWGYIWGIAGLILSVPITAFLKTLLEQFPRTKVIANIMS